MQHLQLQKAIKDINTTIAQRDFFSVMPYLEDFKSIGFSSQQSFQLNCLIKFDKYEELQYSIYMLSKIKNKLTLQLDINKLANLINNLNYFFRINTDKIEFNDLNSEYFYSILDRIVHIFYTTYLELLNYGFNEEESFDIASNLEYNIILEDNIDDIYIDFILNVFEIQIFNTLNTINLYPDFLVTVNMDEIYHENLKEWFHQFINSRPDLVFFFINSLKSLNI